MARKQRVLLIDADLLVYLCGSRAEEVGSFPHSTEGWEVYHRYARLDKAWGDLRATIKEFEVRLQADGSRIALSDLDSARNWRRRLYPEYKANRTGSTRPLVFYQLRKMLEEELDAKSVESLEGDDVLGIWATWDFDKGAEQIICSTDKDMRTIPGLHYDWGHDKRGVVAITPAEAERYHMLQTLTGDATDNYGGVPGMGPVRAKAWLEKKGYEWREVRAAFHKAKQTDDDFLMNARCARILQKSDWDSHNRQVRLWEPPEERA